MIGWTGTNFLTRTVLLQDMTKIKDLTHEIIDDAYCIDFEMRQNDIYPAMMGWTRGDNFNQIVFDRRLSAAAEYSDLVIVDFRALLDDMVSAALATNSLLIAYSVHEQELLCRLFPEKVKNIKSIYCNANLRKWIKHRFPEEYAEAENKERRRLIANKKLLPSRRVSIGLKPLLKMPVVQYAEASSAGVGSPAEALRYVRAHSDPLTRSAKRKWSSMLTYNRHDVLGMRHLLHFMVDQR